MPPTEVSSETLGQEMMAMFETEAPGAPRRDR